jgi:hypothetical protein
MAVATDKRLPWNGVLAPLAIGGFVLVGAPARGGAGSAGGAGAARPRR